MRRARLAILSFLALVATLSVGRADVTLPAIFGDGMVLQRGRPLPVFGFAEPGEAVTVTIAAQTKSTVASDDERWRVTLDPLEPGDPLVLTIEGRNTVTFEDVLVGEVWLGSGQSNMAWRVRDCNDFEREQPAADFPQIRMFYEGSGPFDTPQRFGTGQWKTCTPETVGEFSGTLYFFGREIHTTLDVPVGLINSSMGGSRIESWFPLDVQLAHPVAKGPAEVMEGEYRSFDLKEARALNEKQAIWWHQAAKRAAEKGEPPPKKPRNHIEFHKRQGPVGGLFNGKIAPFIPFALRGFLWYQGESNSDPKVVHAYPHQLPLLVSEWRELWGAGDLPFAWVQLPKYSPPRGLAQWPVVREAMRRALALPNTGMAITIDIGELVSIHPTDKQTVGRRLAAWALGDVYGLDVTTSGPLFASFETKGNEVVVRFEHTDGGLEADGDELRGFELAGADDVWHPATARIEADRVVVATPLVGEPVAVRYAWLNDPDVSLRNGAGLPASPFTTVDAFAER